jgi:glycosyltransferase involved in cell wall biosynthesis
MISIVTAYYNRKKIFIKTLESISKSNVKNFEVIAVDDGSRESERIEDLTETFPFLRVIRIEPKDKWYVNPCIPFNIGFKESKGDKIIIQNPECFHSDDILSYVEANLNNNDYLSFGCYSLNQFQTSILLSGLDYNSVINKTTYKNKPVDYDGDDGWYNHSKFRPNSYHFCTGIMKSDLLDLGGFDERYSQGIAFDDDELIHRIKLKKMNINFIDNLVVYHLWHYSNDENSTISNLNKRDENFWNLWRKNNYLFNNVTIIENKYKANES